MPADNTFRLRRGTTSEWLASVSPLRSGEPGYDLSTNILKIGNGIDTWTNLKSVLDITGNSSISGNLSATSGNFTSALTVKETGVIGEGDGISINTNGISVNNTVVRTAGNQSMNGVKTFVNGIRVSTAIFGLNLNNVPSNQFRIGYGTTTNPLWSINILPSSLNMLPGTNGTVTIMSLISGDNTIYLPSGGPGRDGTLALLSDINASQFTGVLDVNKGGTGQTSYSNGQLLIGSGTSLTANTLTAGTGIFINNEAGKITINSTSSIDRDAVENIIASGNKNTTGFLRNGSGLAWTYTDSGANPGTLSVGITGIDLSLIPGLSGYFNDNLNTSIVQSTGIGLTYNSLTSQLLISVTGISTNLINNFNSSVSGLLPNIANSGDNRILTSTGSTLGINAEADLGFDGTAFYQSAGNFSTSNDAQFLRYVARQLTTDATANQVLFLDGSSTRITIPAKTTCTFTVKLSAYNDTDNAGAGWIFRGVIRRNNANSTVLVTDIIEENWEETSMKPCVASVVADNTNSALEIRVTGIASKNIRWVAVIDMSKVSF